MDNNFGRFLLDCRIKQNLSQSELGDILGYTPQTISNFERGKAFPDLSIWSKYAKALKIDLESFITGKNEKNNDLCFLLSFDNEKFANNLKYLRKKNNLTQKDLAKMVQVNNKTILSYEQGKSSPSISTFIKLCNLYQLKMDELYFVIQLEGSKKETKPIKKKRIFVPIILPIIIVTAVTSGGAVLATNAIRNRNNNHSNSNDINIIDYSSDNSSTISSSDDIASSNIIDSSSNSEYSSSDITSSSSDPSSSTSNESSESSSSSEITSPTDSFTYEVTSNTITITEIDVDLDEIVIPETIDGYLVDKIEPSAITALNAYQNKTLKKFVFGEAVTIDDFESLSFNEFGSLESVSIPINAEEISVYQFNNCHLLKEITIPANIVKIGGSAFGGCSNLKTVNITSNKLTRIEDCVFRYCYKLENINIPDCVTFINDWAFCECTSLKNIRLPNELLTLNNNVFYICSSLLSITIPNKTNTINAECFNGCSVLESVFIPKSVTFINHDAFGSCPNLTIYCEAESQPETWHDNWNADNLPVVWGYSGE